MSSRVSRFLMISIVFVLLVACGVDTPQAIPSQTEEIELAGSQSEGAENTDTVKVVETEVKKTEPALHQVNESTVTTVENKEAEPADLNVSELQIKNQEQALTRLLAETHLERDGYSYYFAQIDSVEYIQIEVREIKEDSEHTSLEGVYRYSIKTDEILMRDYLTGDFVPYVETE